MLRQKMLSSLLLVCLLITLLLEPSYSPVFASDLAEPPVVPVQLPNRPGQSGWDEKNVQSAFEPSSRRGSDPVLKSLGVSRQALQSDAFGVDSGNFQFSVPILHLPGRGLDLNLELHYNSRLWHCASSVEKGKCKGRMVFDMDGDWPAPGWSLGFGKLVEGEMLIDADGTRHNFKIIGTQDAGGGNKVSQLRTIDGSFIDYSVITSNGALSHALAYYPDGTVVVYGAYAGRALYPKRIIDRNGNYIAISYRNDDGPTINTITDTLGRVVSFHYDNQGKLTAIVGPGYNNSTQTLIRLTYKTWQLGYVFSKGLIKKENDSQPGHSCHYNPEIDVSTLSALYFPGTSSGYWFDYPQSYSSYGMLNMVSEQHAMTFLGGSLSEQGTIAQGKVTHERTYDYRTEPEPIGSFCDEGHPEPKNPLSNTPQYKVMTERWVGMNASAPSAVTQYQVFQDSRSVAITYPDGTRSTQLFDNGLVSSTVLTDTNGKTLQKTVVTWEAGDYDSPRIKRLETFGELTSQKTITEYDYGPEHNQVTEVRTYDLDGVTLLRREQTEYVTDSAYMQQAHIFNLPKVSQVFDGTLSTLLSHVEFAYDEEELLATPGVVSHLDKPLYRGNLTTITRYTDAVSQLGAITEEHRYDDVGNLVHTFGSCCVESFYTYEANSQYAYPTTVVQGSFDPSSHAQLRTTTSYDFNTGVPMSSTDANGSTTLFTYWDESVRLRAVAGSAGGYVTFDYDDAAMTTTESAFDEAGQLATRKIGYFNGLGQLRRTEQWIGDEDWTVTEAEYDNMGRVKRQSNPFAKAANPVDEQKEWHEITYDGLGRVTHQQAPDGSSTYQSYNEADRPDAASPAAGQTLRTTDAWGRERWMRTNALGQLVEVVMPNPNGTGSVFEAGSIATYYGYDGLGRLLQVLQGPRPQFRQFRYDSLGRLTHQYLPEKLATLNNQGKYVAGGAQWSDIFTYDARGNLVAALDARGVKTLYHFNDDPLNRLQSIEYDTSSVGDTSSTVLPASTVHFEYMATGDVTRLWHTTTEDLSTEEFSYDTLGRLWAKTVTLPNQPTFPLVVQYGYDSLNRPTEITYPAQYGVISSPRKVIHQDYHSSGGFDRVTVDGQSYADIVYNPIGQLAEIIIGPTGTDQLEEVYQYDPVTQFLSRQQVIRSGTVLFDLSYDYIQPWISLALDPVAKRTGQVTKVIDNLDQAGNRTYTYDTWGRLHQAQSGTSKPFQTYDWLQQYAYDDYGNRTDVKAFGPPTPIVCPDPADCTPPPAPELSAEWRDGLGALIYDTKTNHITSAGFAYDAAGNQIRSVRSDGGGQRYEYDAAGRLINVLDEHGELLESYSYYGASNLRLRTQFGDTAIHPRYYMWEGNSVIAEFDDVPHSGPTIPTASDGPIISTAPDEGPASPDEALEMTDLEWARSYVYLGGRLLSTISSATDSIGEIVQYHHPDRLSTRLITNAISNDMTSQETFPFGVEIPGSSNGGMGRQFTSYDRSGASGLDYAVNRYYDPQQGRFNRVDPIGMQATSLESTLTLNLYAYVKGDPVNASDSTGLDSPEGVTCGLSQDGERTVCKDSAERVVYDKPIGTSTVRGNREANLVGLIPDTDRASRRAVKVEEGATIDKGLKRILQRVQCRQNYFAAANAYADASRDYEAARISLEVAKLGLDVANTEVYETATALDGPVMEPRKAINRGFSAKARGLNVAAAGGAVTAAQYSFVSQQKSLDRALRSLSAIENLSQCGQ